METKDINAENSIVICDSYDTGLLNNGEPVGIESIAGADEKLKNEFNGWVNEAQELLKPFGFTVPLLKSYRPRLAAIKYHNKGGFELAGRIKSIVGGDVRVYYSWVDIGMLLNRLKTGDRMKNEDELLDLIAKAHNLMCLGYVKDFIAENVIYDTQWFNSPMLGKEKFCAENERWFDYNRLFSVSVDTLRYSDNANSMGYVSLEVDYDEVKSCIVIESEDGLITRIYEVRPINTGRRQFQHLKKCFFLPRLAVVPGQTQLMEPPAYRNI